MVLFLTSVGFVRGGKGFIELVNQDHSFFIVVSILSIPVGNHISLWLLILCYYHITRTCKWELLIPTIHHTSNEFLLLCRSDLTCAGHAPMGSHPLTDIVRRLRFKIHLRFDINFEIMMILQCLDLHTKTFNCFSILKNLVVLVKVILTLLIFVNYLEYALRYFETDIFSLLDLFIPCQSCELFQIHLVKFSL